VHVQYADTIFPPGSLGESFSTATHTWWADLDKRIERPTRFARKQIPLDSATGWYATFFAHSAEKYLKKKGTIGLILLIVSAILDI
jgi:hypothetical protein